MVESTHDDKPLILSAYIANSLILGRAEML